MTIDSVPFYPKSESKNTRNLAVSNGVIHLLQGMMNPPQSAINKFKRRMAKLEKMSSDTVEEEKKNVSDDEDSSAKSRLSTAHCLKIWKVGPVFGLIPIICMWL